MSEVFRHASAAPVAAFEITIDGAPVTAYSGQTIAAALVDAHLMGWRVTRVLGEERGLFCGIGVCFDCLVTVNGVRSLRACLVAAAPGDAVTTEQGSGYADLAV